MFRIIKILLIYLTVMIGACGYRSENTSETWHKVDDGLMYAFFDAAQKTPIGDSKIIVIKIDPHKYEFKLLSAKELKTDPKTIREWAEQFGLITAVNAGMFQADYKTNVGFMKNYNYYNNPRVHPRYHSVFACEPVDTVKNPRAKIFDSDEVEMKDIRSRYQVVIQNLRLVKRPGINRWQQQNKRWSEVALGEDVDGNILFIFSRSPYSMHDFNGMLLKLPIHLVSAQHLEGGPEASLYLKHGETELVRVGSFETDFNQNDSNKSMWPLPNVLGIVKRK